jgi:hypothetical protein
MDRLRKFRFGSSSFCEGSPVWGSFVLISSLLLFLLVLEERLSFESLGVFPVAFKTFDRTMLEVEKLRLQTLLVRLLNIFLLE